MNSQPASVTASWSVEGLGGLELFRAADMEHAYTKHAHETYTIGVIEKGIGGNHCRGARHDCPAGSIVVMKPGDAHTGYSVGGPFSYRMFYVSDHAFRRALGEAGALPHFDQVVLDDLPWAVHLRALHQMLEYPAHPLEYQLRTDEALSAFARAFGAATPPERGGREHKAVTQVKAYLHAHYRESVSIDDLAVLTGLHRAYLIRSFHREVGLPPYAYLMQLRVRDAKRLLAQGEPIAQVAIAVGFADQSHLTRTFKRILGVTPAQYSAGHYRSRH